MRTIKTYSELMTFPTFLERYDYLNLKGRVGDPTFGSKRYLNQILYKSERWLRFRDKIIIRDNGCDLGIEDREIMVRLTVHHIDPITIEDVLSGHPKVFDPENAITTADMTHKAIHYGNEDLLMKEPTIRREYDTCPWKQ